MSTFQRRDPPRWLPPLSSALAEALPRLYGAPPEPLLTELMEALTRALEQGELAIDLQGPAPEGISTEAWPAAHRRALEASPLSVAPHGPLALEGSLLRWRRWERLRQGVMEGLIARAQRQNPASSWLPPAELRDSHQLLAVRTALERDLLVLAGGPGTGKTSTVAHILAAVAEQQSGARIHLAAPTGKAAARLRAATHHLWPCTTLHQLLESRGEGEFRRNRQRPLKLDLLVVDEGSMVDLALMEALLVALPDEARLVLVGDPAQLPPVAPGAPLQELLDADRRLLLEGAVVTLQTPYRNAGAIAAVASALREQIHSQPGPLGNPIEPLRASLAALPAGANVHWQERELGPLPASVVERLQEHLLTLGEAAQACTPGTDAGWQELVALRDQLLVLTPRHRGPWGVEAVHRQLLAETSAASMAQWPSGTPVLCTRNLHGLGLSNGDLGVLVAREDRWLVFGQDQPIWLAPSQLSGALEPALALTVHKAQGSEAERVMVLLPEPEGADPRLLYTALTRAREEVWLFTPLAG
ncbi:MAG: AAA family ATPase [Cyanobacteriota bacterium]|nr:AAA family ATPase [Cyanobacteriota bacterium]